MTQVLWQDPNKVALDRLLGIPVYVTPQVAFETVILADRKIITDSFEGLVYKLWFGEQWKQARSHLAELVADAELRLFGPARA